MRHVLFLSLLFLALSLPAPAQDAKKTAIEAIKKAVDEISLGTSLEEVKKRPGFEYYDDLKICGGRIDGVGIFTHFKGNKVSRLNIHDPQHAQGPLRKFLEERYGAPVKEFKVGPRTTYYFEKEGLPNATLTLTGGKSTNLDISNDAPEK